MASTLDCNCRSLELTNATANGTHFANQLTKLNVRYKIVNYVSSATGDTEANPLNNFTLLDLSGDVPDLTSDQRPSTLNGTQNKLTEKVLNAPLESKLIDACFASEAPMPSARTASISSESDGHRFWGRISGNMESNAAQNDSSANISLTIGNQVMCGKRHIARDGTHTLILRKVPDHCACLCSNTMDNKIHGCHPGYYEVCGVINSTLVFNDRPAFNFHTLDSKGDDQDCYLYASPNIRATQSKWMIIKVDEPLLEEILKERAYFKVVNGDSKQGQRVVLCIPGTTFNIERIEIGGSILLLYRIVNKLKGHINQNILAIIGHSKFLHRLVKVVPNYEALPRNTLLDPKHILELLPLSDEEIQDFLLHRTNGWPCFFVHLQDGFKYLEMHIFGEFALKLLCTLPIYYSKVLKHKPCIYNLTVKDIVNLVEIFGEHFEFLNRGVSIAAIVVQLLMELCDFENNPIDFISLLNIESVVQYLFSTRVTLNLYKIHKIIVWSLVKQNEPTKYTDLASKVDELVFNDAIPSYIFDDLIKYMLNKETFIDPCEKDYRDVLLYYYDKYSYDDVSNLLDKHFNTEKYKKNHVNLFNKTSPSLFTVLSIPETQKEWSKTNCFNYRIFQLNTKGLTLLRYNYSMNELLATCKTPMSLHVGFLARKFIARVEHGICFLNIYPPEEKESLKDGLSALFQLGKRWHLEVCEQKLKQFFKDKKPLEALTGGPEYHARLWVKREVNEKNYTPKEQGATLESCLQCGYNEGNMEPQQEESYIIVNSNVPIEFTHKQ